ncbi:MAG TPA: hypothetical protein VFC63_12460 [Blastocatellia bacterium]|nr:hypothetical protein [Blastocatellia bacterium]
MKPASSSTSHFNAVVVLAAIAAVVATLRYFMRGWVTPLHIPTAVGSMIASVTVVLVIGLFILFIREGRNTKGRYVRAASYFFVFGVWCEALVIAGILITERTGAQTYYDGPWEMVHHMFSSPTAHAIGHTQGFFVRTAIWLILGAILYVIAKRRRHGVAQTMTAQG